MTTSLYAAPYTPPAAPESTVVRQGFRWLWTGWDGSVWDLGDRSSGVYLRPGVRGTHMPPFQRFTSRAAGVPGARTRGKSRAEEREAFWPLSVFTDGSSQEWVEYDRAFWRTMHPDLPGVWSIQQPGTGETRYLTCVYADTNDPALSIDPALVGWSRYDAYLVALDPFWRGVPIVQSWAASTSRNFYGLDVGQTGGPPFYVSHGSSFARARVSNPGDEATSALWLVNGPTTSAHVGVNGKQVIIPWSVAEGRTVVVDTARTAQTAVEVDSPSWVVNAGESRPSNEAVLAWARDASAAGTNRTRELGSSTKFEPIPAGQSVTLAIEVTGAGSVTAIIEPRYHRAW